jgi:hypothetical protein
MADRLPLADEQLAQGTRLLEHDSRQPAHVRRVLRPWIQDPRSRYDSGATLSSARAVRLEASSKP